MDAAIVFTYTRSTPGRESKSLEAFTEALRFFRSLAAAGTCGEPLTFMGPSGTSLLIVPGSRRELFGIVALEGFREMYLKAVFSVKDIHYEIGDFGEGAERTMAQWARIGGELALM